MICSHATLYPMWRLACSNRMTTSSTPSKIIFLRFRNKAGDRGTGNVEGRRNDTGCWDEVDKARPPLPEPQRVSPSSPLRSDCSRLRRWGPGATSKDAMKFFRAVI